MITNDYRGYRKGVSVRVRGEQAERGQRVASNSTVRPLYLLSSCDRDPLLHRDERARFVSDPDLAWPGDLLLGIGHQLLPLRQPSGRAWNGEEHGEHFGPESHRLVHDSRIEIDIGIELALHEVIILESDALQFQGDLDLGIATRDFEDPVGRPLDDLRAWIVVLVHAVPEAHQFPAAFLDLLHIGGDILFRD